MPRADHGTVSVSRARGRKTAPLAITVNVTPTLLAPLDGHRVAFLVHNNEAQTVMYIGRDNTLTAANGVPVAAGDTFTESDSYDEWWGIVAAASADARIIITTLDA